VLLTEDASKRNVQLVTPTVAPYTWIAPTQPYEVVIVTSPPQVFTTEVYIDSPYPVPVVQTVVVSLTPTATYTATPTFTATSFPSPTFDITPEVTFEVTLESAPPLP